MNRLTGTLSSFTTADLLIENPKTNPPSTSVENCLPRENASVTSYCTSTNLVPRATRLIPRDQETTGSGDENALQQTIFTHAHTKCLLNTSYVSMEGHSGQKCNLIATCIPLDRIRVPLDRTFLPFDRTSIPFDRTFIPLDRTFLPFDRTSIILSLAI